MPVTPEQARAELARREAVKRGVTPEQARAELARRQAAKPVASPTLPAHLQRPVNGLAALADRGMRVTSTSPSVSTTPSDLVSPETREGFHPTGSLRPPVVSDPRYAPPPESKAWDGPTAWESLVQTVGGDVGTSIDKGVERGVYSALGNVGTSVAKGLSSLGLMDREKARVAEGELQRYRDTSLEAATIGGQSGAELVGPTSQVAETAVGLAPFFRLEGAAAMAPTIMGARAFDVQEAGGSNMQAAGLGALDAAANTLPFNVGRLIPGAPALVRGTMEGTVGGAIGPMGSSAISQSYGDTARAQAEHDEILLSMGLGTVMGAGTSASAPRTLTAAPTRASAPPQPLEPLPSPTNLVIPEGIPSYAADAPAPPREAPYAVTPEVIQAVRDNPQLTTSVRDIAENMAANTPDTGLANAREREAVDAARQNALNHGVDESIRQQREQQRSLSEQDALLAEQRAQMDELQRRLAVEEQGRQEAATRDKQNLVNRDVDESIRQQQADALLRKQVDALTPPERLEAIGRDPDATPPNKEKELFDVTSNAKATFDAQLRFITSLRNRKGEGRIGKNQAAQMRDEAKAKFVSDVERGQAEVEARFAQRAKEEEAQREVEKQEAEARVASVKPETPAPQRVLLPLPKPMQQKTGAAHLSPEGQAYIKSLKPGERALLSDAVQAVRTQGVTSDKEVAFLQRALAIKTRAPETDAPTSETPAPQRVLLPHDAPPAPPAPNQRILNLPGYQHLSPEARAYLASLKPGQRALLKGDVHTLKSTPTADDTSYLKRALTGFEGNAGKRAAISKEGVAFLSSLKPGQRAKIKWAVDELRTSPRDDDVDFLTKALENGPPSKVPPRTPPPPDNSTPPPPSGGPPPPRLFSHAGEIPKRTTDWFHERIWKVLEAKPGGKEVARKGREVITQAKRLAGTLTMTSLKAAKTLTGPKGRAVARSLLEERTAPSGAVYTRLHDLAELRASPRPEEASFMRLFRDLHFKSGKVFEGVGGTIRSKTGVRPFTADRERSHAPRVFGKDLIYYAQRPGDPVTKEIVEMLQKENPDVTLKQIQNEVEGFGSIDVTKRGMAEDARVIENFPPMFRTKAGKTIHLLSTKPQEMLDAMAERMPARAAFVSRFGQEAVPKEFQEMLAKTASPDVRRAAENLFRTLNVMGLEDIGADAVSGATGPSSSLVNKVGEGVAQTWRTIKAAKLSMSWVPAIAEGAGKPAVISGQRNMAKALAKHVLTPGAKKQAVLDDLVVRGIVTKKLTDWFWDKYGKTESAGRVLSNVLHGPSTAMNEFTETITGEASKYWVEALQEGHGGAIDYLSLVNLDFTPAEAKSILKGKFSEYTADDIRARAVEWSLSSTSSAAEKSRWLNSKAFNTVTLGQRFASANFNRNLHTVLNAVKYVTDPSAPNTKAVEAVSRMLNLPRPADAALRAVDRAAVGATQVGRAAAYQTAAAGATLMLKAALVGGGAVLADKATGSPLGAADFVKEALVYALFGDMVSNMARAMSGSDDGKTLGEQAISNIVPTTLFNDVIGVYTNNGRYAGLPAAERWTKFMKSQVSATPMVNAIAGVTGLWQHNAENEQAVKAFYAWKRKYDPSGKFVDAGATDEDKTYRAGIRSAQEDILHGIDPMPSLRRALGVKDGKEVAKALRARRYLSDYDVGPRTTRENREEKERKLQAVSSYLGPRTISALRAHDELLSELADTIERE